jgi:tRNA(Ile2) C34 agmatinyltransferase TiaS
MTCAPFCDLCGGNLGHPANGDWTCNRCKLDALRKSRKERIRKDEFEPDNPTHFRLQSRGGAWRYYRKVGA